MIDKEEIRNKKILVTGGAGFIGSHLCEELINLGALVRCLDNLSTGNKSNISNLLKHKRFEFYNYDIRNLKDCQSACNDIDIVLHQAALGSVTRSIIDPLESNNVNINGFLNMLIASRDNNVKRFVFAASSSTYGDSVELPKVESTIGTPLSPYALTKYVNEIYAELFQKFYKLNYIGLRYFNVFGPKQDPNGPYAAVIPIFIKQFLNGESPTINGDGTFSRDFTYIKNVIQMNLLSITTMNPLAINQIYNTACGDRTSLNQLFQILKNQLSRYDNKIKSIKANYGRERDGDIPHSEASIEKAKEHLYYEPKYNIDSGISESIEWYIKNL